MLFLFNFLILFGPLVFFGIKQMKAYEPGDADWGVRLDDVRGQAEPKEDEAGHLAVAVRRGVSRRGRQARARAAVHRRSRDRQDDALQGHRDELQLADHDDAGSGFASTFMGMDVVIVLILIGRARRLARKWGGQCIIFIDEIDAVGLRRQALGAGGFAGGMTPSPSSRVVSRLRVPRADGRADLQRRPRPRVARLAREAVRPRATPAVDPLPPFWRG